MTHVSPLREGVLVGAYVRHEWPRDANPGLEGELAAVSHMFIVGDAFRDYRLERHSLRCGLPNPPMDSTGAPTLWLLTSPHRALATQEIVGQQGWAVVIQSGNDSVSWTPPSTGREPLRVTAVPHDDLCTVRLDRTTAPRFGAVVVYQSFSSSVTWGMELWRPVRCFSDLHPQSVVI